MFPLDTFQGFTDKSPKPDYLAHLVELMRSDSTLQVTTHAYRYAREAGDKRQAQQLKSSVLCFAVAVRFAGGKADTDITAYTGLTLVDLDGIDPAQLPTVLATVKADPHTLLAYVTLSGRGVRVLTRYALNDDENENLRAVLRTPPSQSDTPSINRGGVSSTPTHPAGEHQQNPPLFIEGVPVGRGRSKHSAEQYKLAFTTVNEYYHRLTGCTPDLKCSNPTRLSALAHDPDVHYRPDAQPMDIATLAAQYEAERQAAKRPVGRPKKGKSEEGLGESGHPDGENFQFSTFNFQFVEKQVLASVESQGIRYEEGTYNKYVSSVCYEMNRYGVPQEQCRQWAISYFADYDTPDVEAIVRSCYRKVDEHATVKPRRAARGESQLGDVRDIRQYLIDCDLQSRYNTVTRKYEIYDPATLGWCEKTARMESILYCRATEGIGKRITKSDLRNVLESDYSVCYDPFLSYLESLPPHTDADPDYIAQVASMVHVACGKGELHRRWFKKWFVAMVASWLDPRVINHVILAYIGPQGIYKSTFMRRLMPPQLEGYFTVRNFAHRMDRDDLLLLTEKGLVALEEIDSLTPRELNQLKAIVTAETIDERAPYAAHNESRPHVASFCATGNNRRFLTDLTGNRRWLPFYVTDIDSPYTHAIPYEGLYAQAYRLYREDFQYWFDADEVAALDEHNAHFEEPNMVQELIETYFRHPYEGEAGQFYNTANILTAITTYCGSRITISSRDIATWMRRLGYVSCRVGNLRGWNVVPLTGNEIHDNHCLNAHRSSPETDAV